MKKYILPLVIVFLAMALLLSIIAPKKSTTIKQERWMQENWGPTINNPSILSGQHRLIFDESSNYRTAIETAKKSHKPIFVFFKADWCGWCKKMEVDTLAKPSVRKILSQYVYCVIDSDKDKDVAKKYKVSSIPAYVIINANEEVLKTGKGYKNESTFIVWMNSKFGDSKAWGNVIWR